MESLWEFSLLKFKRPLSAQGCHCCAFRRRSAIHTRSSHSTYAGGLSVMGSRAEYSAAAGHGSQVPQPDIRGTLLRIFSSVKLGDFHLSHWITSSAPARIVGEIVRPSAFAVLRFTVRLNLRGGSIGTAAGLAPLRTRSTKPAARRNRSL
jgi:hypothetical protein